MRPLCTSIHALSQTSDRLNNMQEKPHPSKKARAIVNDKERWCSFIRNIVVESTGKHSTVRGMWITGTKDDLPSAISLFNFLSLQVGNKYPRFDRTRNPSPCLPWHLLEAWTKGHCRHPNPYWTPPTRGNKWPQHLCSTKQTRCLLISAMGDSLWEGMSPSHHRGQSASIAGWVDVSSMAHGGNRWHKLSVHCDRAIVES